MSEKTLLVTGAAGFIGSRFAQRAHENSFRILSIDKGSYFNERKDLPLPFGQVIDRDVLLENDFRILEDHQEIDAIIHLGACTDTTELDVGYLKQINLEYSKALWTLATKKEIPFIYASSAATYGSGDQGYDDDESKAPLLKPLNPYGDSKQAFDLWVLEQERLQQNPPKWAGFKFFNVYGYGERHKEKMASVVFHAFHQIMETQRVKLFKSYHPNYKDGEQVRDFVLVEDVLNVLFFALEGPIKRGIYNLGTGTARTFIDLVRPVFHAIGLTEDIEFIEMPEALRERYQYHTEAKMDRLINAGYQAPFTPVEDGVKHYTHQLLSHSQI